MSIELVNVILGMKVRQARLDAGMSATELAKSARLSPSYLTEIEKGRKHPKPDKILQIAAVLGKEYDDLVSIRLGSSLGYLESALKSPLIGQFPFEEFGLEISDLVTILTRAPEQASAMLHAITDIARQVDLEEENFLRAMLRSYQEINENYFDDLEGAAANFATVHHLNDELPVSLEKLQEIIQTECGYELDEERLTASPALSGYRSVFFGGKTPRLLINSQLFPKQIKFLLAREIGYKVLGLKERSVTSTPDEVSSFRQVLNDFKASYFGGALLMPQAAMLADLEGFMGMPAFSPQPLLDMLTRYDVTPEMLLYRFSELIPQFFGVSMHFLRMHWNGQRYRLSKQLNMSRLLIPSGLNLAEHFCRRWLTVRLLQEMPAATNESTPHINAQMSETFKSGERFLCIGFARPLALAPKATSSVIVGFRVDQDLKNTMRFWDDPAIPQTIINETCEQCPLTEEQCEVRAAPATKWHKQQQKQAQQAALAQLRAELRKI